MNGRVHLVVQLVGLGLAGVMLWQTFVRPAHLRRRQRAVQRELRELERAAAEERDAARQLAAINTFPYFNPNGATA